MKKLTVLLFSGLLIGTGFAQNECLIVRSAEGHRFRDSMIAGALTGGIGFAAGALVGGAKYEYVDSFHMSNTKLKYKGSELQKLQKDGVHIIVINKKATADETKSARESCVATSTPAAVPPQAAATVSAPTKAVSAPANSAPATQPTARPARTAAPQVSLGEVAGKMREEKAAQPWSPTTVVLRLTPEAQPRG